MSAAGRYQRSYLEWIITCSMLLHFAFTQAQVSVPGGVSVGVPGGPGIPLPLNVLSGYPNPYANKAPAYRSVYLYRASEFPGLAGKSQSIRSIFFDDSIPQRAMLRNFTIRMKHVTWDTMPHIIPDEGFETVYFPRTYVDIKGINEHALDIPFCWDGVSNFLVDICVQNPANEMSDNASIRVTIPDSGKYSSYHDWNNSGDPICMASGQVQDSLYIKRPLTYFANIPGDSLDLQMMSVSSPAELLEVNTAHQVTFRFMNYSCPTGTGIKLGYQWNSNPPVIEDYQGTVVKGQQATYTFNTKLNAFPAQFSILKIWTQHPNDVYRYNDTITMLVFVKDKKFDGLDYTGKDFWIAFMQNYNNENLQQKLFLTSTQPVTAEVAIPLLGWSRTVTLAPNTIQTVNVDVMVNGVSTATIPADTISPTGIHISADQEISVYAYSGIQNSGDAYLAIPRRTLGRNYIVTSPEGIYNTVGVGSTLINAPAEFIVVATEDSTRVEIIPPVPTERYNAFDTIRAVLQQGQTFMVKARVEYNSTTNAAIGTHDLTGTIVRSDKKIGLIGGSQCALIPGYLDPENCQSCDHLLEMLTPPSTWGSAFYTTDFEVKQGKDVLRIINAEPDPVTVTHNTGTLVVPAGSFVDHKFTGEIFLTASTPFQVIQMCTGGACDIPTSATDPFITNLIPESQWGNYYTFVTPVTSNLPVHYINIIKKSAAGRVALDGILIPASRFKPIGTTGYYAAKQQVSIGVHKVSGDSVLAVTVYGFGRDNSYGYPASGSFLKILDRPMVEIAGISQNITCNGKKNGHIEVTAKEGTPPYSFYWNDGKTGAVRDSLSPGAYYCFVEDDYGYHDTAYFVITEPTKLSITTSGKNLSCFQSRDGAVSAAVNGGTPPLRYLWNNGDSTPVSSNLVAGTYNVTVIDSQQCSISGMVKITEPTKVKLSITTEMPSCNGGKDGKITVTPTGGSGGFNYTWQEFPGYNTGKLTGLTKNTYHLQIADKQKCTIDTAIIVNEPEPLKVNFDVTNVGCFNESAGTIVANGEGGYGSYTYTWHTAPPKKTQTLTGLVIGMYTVTMSDGKCTKTDSAYVDSVATPSYRISAELAFCDKPNGKASITASGGSGNYNVVWKTSPLQVGFNAVNLAAGNYEVFVSDGVCKTTLPFTVPGIPGPRYDLALQPASCGLNNGSAALSNVVANGNYNITWKTNPQQSGPSVSNLKAGNYTFTVKDSLCEASKSFTIGKVPEIKNLKFNKTLPDCEKSNGVIVASAAGGSAPLQFTWNTDPPKKGATLNNIPAGTYQVEVTDGVCTLRSVVSLPNKLAPAISFNVVHPKCGMNNGEINATITGGTGDYTLTWNNDTTLNNNRLPGLLPGTYSLKVSDGACIAGLDTTLVDQPAPEVSLAPEPARCGLPNGSITAAVSGGTGNYSMTWNGSAGNSTIADLSPGNYLFEVNDGRCIVRDSAVIIAIAPPSVEIVSLDSAYCSKPTGQVQVNPVGGSGVYTLTWLTTPEQQGNIASGLAAGIHIVVVDDLYCRDTLDVTIPERLLPQLVHEISPEHCNLGDGKAGVKVLHANPPISVSWQGSPSSDLELPGLVSGWYHYTLTDKYCFKTDSIFVPLQDGPKIKAGSILPARCALDNGEAEVLLVSANESYTVQWSTNPSQTQWKATGLATGDYWFHIIGQYCRDSLRITIPEIPDLQYRVDSVKPATCDLKNGKVVLALTGGQGSYNVSWASDPVNKTMIFHNAAPGWHTYTVSDDHCTYTDSVEVIAIPPPYLAQSVTGPDWCQKSNGFIQVTAAGGAGNYSYNWTGFGPGSNQLAGLAAGTYALILSDSNCSFTYNFTVGRGYAPAGKLQLLKDETCGRADGSALVADLEPGCSIVWDGIPGGQLISNLQAGQHMVKLANQHCDTSINFTVNEIKGPQLSFQLVPDTCSSGRGQLAYSSLSGTQPLSFFLDNKPVSNAGQLTGIKEGSYWLKATDKNQCADSVPIIVESITPAMTGAAIVYEPAEPATNQAIEFTPRLPWGWRTDHWTINNVIAGISEKYRQAALQKESDLYVTLVAKHFAGCMDSVEMYIPIRDDFHVYIPNTFTPDGDGYNDLFAPVTYGITTMTGTIFDRWGAPVYTFTSIKDQWDGKMNNEFLKSDTYLFRFTFTNKKGEQVKHSGKITLLR